MEHYADRLPDSRKAPAIISAPNASALPDDDLLSLGQHFFDAADRQGSTVNDLAELRDFVPALLHRLREKVDATRDVPLSEVSDIDQPDLFERVMQAANDRELGQD